MNLTKLVPNIFYVNIHDALKLFIDCLEFKIEHDKLNSKIPFCVVAKNGLRINIFQDEKLAKEHNPEFRLVIEILKKSINKFQNRIRNFYTQICQQLLFAPGKPKNSMDRQLGIVIQEL